MARGVRTLSADLCFDLVYSFHQSDGLSDRAGPVMHLERQEAQRRRDAAHVGLPRCDSRTPRPLDCLSNVGAEGGTLLAKPSDQREGEILLMGSWWKPRALAANGVTDPG